jgi:DUF971 family protein
MPSAAILRLRCLIARSMPLSPTATSRGLHWTDSVGFAKGGGILQTPGRSASVFRFGDRADPLDTGARPPKNRRAMSEDLRIRPTGVKAPHGADVFEIRWADGVSSRIPHPILRGYCPCAGCQGHGGGVHFVEGGDLTLRDLEQVGNYALQLTWGDGHATGIYTFRYLRRLGDLVAAHGDALPAVHPELPPP